MKDEERHQFVNRVFDTFSWRSVPEETWLGFEDNYEYDWYNDGFVPVHPREFDFQVFDAHPFKRQGDRLCLMTVEGYLYHLPSFVALLMEDISRTNDLGDCVLSSLRGHPPYPGSIARWVQYTRERSSLTGSGHTHDYCFGDSLLRSLEDWFLRKTNLGHCKHIVNMTPDEREIVAQFLDELVKHRDFCDEAHQIQAVQSVLRNESYGRRLGARTEDDIVQLLALLGLAVNKYPASFPAALAEDIRRELERTKTT